MSCELIEKNGKLELSVTTNNTKKSTINNLISSEECDYIEYHPYTSNGNCYIATCVYGSYDCPQVWTLRRFRDYTLAQTWFGRTFIKCYYASSPILVKWFGKQKWFKFFWKNILDTMINQLNRRGFEDTQYFDGN